jgi:hypothetical protein
MPYCHFYKYAILMIRLDTKNECLYKLSSELTQSLHVFAYSLLHFLVFSFSTWFLHDM